MTDRKAVIKNADMSEDMQQDAVDCATQAIEKYNIEKVSTILCYDGEILLEFVFVWIVMRWFTFKCDLSIVIVDILCLRGGRF